MKQAIVWAKRFSPVVSAAAWFLMMAVFITTPLAMAKYVSSAIVSASARVAKFDIRVGSRNYNDSGDWYPDTTNVDAASANTEDPTKYWRKLTISAGTNTVFKLPLFDYEYSANQSDRSKTTTVLSADGSLVAAPGTGLIGAGKHNPNDLVATTNPNDWSQIFFKIKNSSEVAVRVKIEYDPANSTIPQLNSSGTVVSGNGTTANAKLPILLRPYRANTANAFLISNCTVLTNIFAYTEVPGDLKSPDSVSGKNYSAFTDNFKADKWIYLEPGQETGGAETTDPPNIGICWYWMFAHTGQWGNPANGWPDGMADQGYAEQSAGTAGTNFGDQAAGANWGGFSNASILPFLPGTGSVDPETGTTITAAKVRANNIDRFDTLLGMAAAKGTLDISLAFRVTVEQVD